MLKIEVIIWLSQFFFISLQVKSIKTILNMILLILKIALYILASLLTILLVFCVYHFSTDQYDIQSAMRLFKKECCKKEYFLKNLNALLGKMESCPKISKDMQLIEIYETYLKAGELYLYICGDADGKPRFFAYLEDRNTSKSEHHNRRKNNRFKKNGLKYSIGIEELKDLINDVSKNIFKDKLIKEEEDVVKNHFNRVLY